MLGFMDSERLGSSGRTKVSGSKWRGLMPTDLMRRSFWAGGGAEVVGRQMRFFESKLIGLDQSIEKLSTSKLKHSSGPF